MLHFKWKALGSDYRSYSRFVGVTATTDIYYLANTQDKEAPSGSLTGPAL